MKLCYAQIALVTLCAVLSGCASSRTNLIARKGSQPFPPNLPAVSLMPRVQAALAERRLEADLSAELFRRGIRVVPPGEAKFTITAVIEVSWDSFLETPGALPNPSGSSTTMMVPLGGSGVSYTTREIRTSVEPVERHVPQEGIRIKIYDARELKRGQFRPVWEGYVEAGFKMRPEQQPTLLKTLCYYLGRDFIGHVKIVN